MMTTPPPPHQAMESPDLCGEVPDHATLLKFLHDFLGQSPASLWADLLQEVSEEPLLGWEGYGSQVFLDELSFYFDDLH